MLVDVVCEIIKGALGAAAAPQRSNRIYDRVLIFGEEYTTIKQFYGQRQPSVAQWAALQRVCEVRCFFCFKFISQFNLVASCFLKIEVMILLLML